MARKIIRLDADQLEAGDTLVLKEGSIRKFYHVCEVNVKGSRVRYSINYRSGFRHFEADADDRVRIRVDE